MQTQHTFFNQNYLSELVGICMSLHSDFSPSARASLHSSIRSKTLLQKGITSVFAHRLFPSQTRASKASEFDEEKSGVLRVRICTRISARPSKVRKWVCIRVACVSDTLRVSSNAYQRSGLLVTPLERCKLQQVHL